MNPLFFFFFFWGKGKEVFEDEFLIGETRDLRDVRKEESTGEPVGVLPPKDDEWTKGIFGASFAKLVQRFWSSGQVYCILASRIRNEESFLRKIEKRWRTTSKETCSFHPERIAWKLMETSLIEIREGRKKEKKQERKKELVSSTWLVRKFERSGDIKRYVYSKNNRSSENRV